LLFIAGLTIIPTLFLALGLALFQTLNTAEMPLWFLRMSLLVNQVSAFLLPALIFSYSVENNWFNFSKSNFRITRKQWMLVTATLLLMLPLISLLAQFNQNIVFPKDWQALEMWLRTLEAKNNALVERMISTPLYLSAGLNLFFMAMLPAVCEEFFFRGTLQPYFLKCFKHPLWAILIVAFIFSAFHLDFFGFIPRFVLGIYLGILVYWTKSLWSAIWAHFLNNGIALLMQYYDII
jgi:membrane protease YdiL (CAAX protease family)